MLLIDSHKIYQQESGMNNIKKSPKSIKNTKNEIYKNIHSLKKSNFTFYPTDNYEVNKNGNKKD